MVLLISLIIRTKVLKIHEIFFKVIDFLRKRFFIHYLCIVKNTCKIMGEKSIDKIGIGFYFCLIMTALFIIINNGIFIDALNFNVLQNSVVPLFIIISLYFHIKFYYYPLLIHYYFRCFSYTQFKIRYNKVSSFWSIKKPFPGYPKKGFYPSNKKLFLGRGAVSRYKIHGDGIYTVARILTRHVLACKYVSQMGSATCAFNFGAFPVRIRYF
jgi:hypothetical protein